VRFLYKEKLMLTNFCFRLSYYFLLVTFAASFYACQTKKSCTAGCQNSKVNEVSIQKQKNAKRMAKNMQNTTLTGASAKDINAYNKENTTKPAVKNKKKQNKTPNKPIL